VVRIAQVAGKIVSEAVPRRVLVQRTVSKGLLGGTSESFEPAGETEAYACADCGFFEEYLCEPRRIPWDRIDGASWHAIPDPGGPYR
jgi:hypothetical protein